MNKKQILLSKLIKKVGSQGKLSKYLGCHFSTISNLLKRDDLLISNKMAYKLRSLFNISDRVITGANDELRNLKNNS